MRDLNEQVIGEYHLKGIFSQSLRSILYRAADEQNRELLVKFLLPDCLWSEELLALFSADAKKLVKIAYPHLAGVNDFGVFEGIPFLVIDFIEGNLLSRWLTKPVPWKEAARLLTPLACALEYAHQFGCYHLGINPSNIMITPNGKPILLNLGITSIYQQALAPLKCRIATRAVIGSVEYMAPEYAQDLGVDARSDIYSLGALYYHLVTGHLPYTAESPMQMLIQHVRQELRRPRLWRIPHRKELPETVEKVIYKAMAKKPEERFQKMGIFASALENLSHGQAVYITALPKLPPLPRSYTWLWILLILLTAAAIPGVIVGISRFNYDQLVARLTAQPMFFLTEAVARAPSLTPASTLAVRSVTSTRPPAVTVPPTRSPIPTHQILPTLQSSPTQIPSLTPSPVIENTTPPVTSTPQSVIYTHNGQQLPVLALTQVPYSDISIGVGNITRLKELARWGYGKVEDIQFSHDGTLIAVGSSSGIYLFNAQSHQQAGFFDVSGWVTSIEFSPDSKILAVGTHEGVTRLWEVKSGKLVSTVDLQYTEKTGAVSDIAFSPDGKSLVSIVGTKAIKIWDIETQKEKKLLPGNFPGHTYPVIFAQFSPDGSLLASGSLDHNILLWDVSTAKVLLTLSSKTMRVTSMDFSKNGDTLASSYEDGTVKIWNVKDGKLLLSTPPGSYAITSVAFLPGDKGLVWGESDGSITCWDIEGKKESWNGRSSQIENDLDPNGAAVRRVMVSPDGTTFLSETASGMIQFWRIPDGAEMGYLNLFSKDIGKVIFSPDSKRLAIEAAGKEINILDVTDGSSMRQYQGHIAEGMPFSVDSILFALLGENNVIEVMDLINGIKVHNLIGYLPNDSISFLPAGTIIASGNSSRLRLWSVYSGLELAYSNPLYSAGICKVALDIDKIFLVAASSNGIIFQWDDDDQRLCKLARSVRAVSVALLPDGRYAAFGMEDGSVMLYDNTLNNSKPLVLKGHADQVESVAFSPDGTLLASASRDHTIRIWEVATGKELLALTSHTDPVFSVTFSPDGRLLASGSSDKTIEIWGIHD